MHDYNDDSGIVRCPKCKKDFIAEEMESHECLVSVKQIPVVYFFTLKDEREEIVIAKGYDGILYCLVKSPKYNNRLPTESQQRKETPDKDNNTIIIIISKLKNADDKLILC
jgi:hypothetical protein